MKKGKYYENMVKEIKEIYHKYSNPELSMMLNLPVRRIKEIARVEKLRKSKETIRRIKSECGTIGNNVRWNH